MSNEQSQIDRRNLSDEELMELYQSSDYLAFEILYQRHSGRIYKFLISKVGTEVGEELLQEAYTRIHKFRDKYIAQLPYLPWVFTIVRNLLKDYYKKAETQTIKNSASLDSHNTETNYELTESDSLSQLNAILENLPKNQQRAVRLRYLDDWTFEKIAEDIETSPENVRQLISRGIKKIRSSFASQGAQE